MDVTLSWEQTVFECLAKVDLSCKSGSTKNYNLSKNINRNNQAVENRFLKNGEEVKIGVTSKKDQKIKQKETKKEERAQNGRKCYKSKWMIVRLK